MSCGCSCLFAILVVLCTSVVHVRSIPAAPGILGSPSQINSDSRGSGGNLENLGTSPLGAPRSCVPKPIEIKQCHLFYNYTGMPNLVGQEHQAEAAHQLQTFNPLISYKCSLKLHFFLCSVYTPMCDVNTKFLIGPCRPLCEHVRDRCLPVLRAFNVEWPANLNCSRFPKKNSADTMCMDGPHIREESPRPIDHDASFNGKTLFTKCGHLKNSKKYVYINRTGSCALLCKANDLFSTDDKYIAEIWMGILSGLCFISTLFTVLTFLIDSQRFKYPERPVVFLAICYCIYSISYFVRLIAGRSAIVCDHDPTSGESILIQEGLDNTDCAITFLIQYFFGTASSVWWVMLTVTWVLAAGLKWGDEAIQRRSCYLHSTAWLVPSILTVVVLIMRAVDSDELLGMCSVGQQRTSTLMAFNIAPSLLFLTLGSLCLLTGFVALLRIRRLVKSDGIKTDKLEVLMVRIGLFSVLYIVPAACVTGCNIYEYIYRESWHRPNSTATPNIEVFMLKTFMSLVVGITSGVWIWSVKTLESWRNFFNRSFCQQAPVSGPGGRGVAGAGAQTSELGCLGEIGEKQDVAGMMPGMVMGGHSGHHSGQNTGSYFGGGQLLSSGSRRGGPPQPSNRLHFPQYDAKYSKANANETVI